MKLIAQLQLKPATQQKAALLATLERANQACDFISELAWEHQVFGQFNLHKISYKATRDRFDLSAQVVVRCIKKVSDAYALDKKVKRTFKPHGAISYDERILTYKVEAQAVSIWTITGRVKMPFVCGERQKELLKTRQGESDLALVKGKWYLLATCNVEEPEIDSSGGVIGCDFGLVEIVATSEGKSYSGDKVKALRRKLRSHRARLQKRGTHSAKRRLKKAAKRQGRFVRNSNHCISKELVKDAKALKKALGLEDLKGIRERSKRLNKEMRWAGALWAGGNWAFAQLRGFCEYKAKAAGVAVVCVDAAYTSRTCSACGHCEKGNRKSQKHFKCLACGFEENADFNASLNISERAAVNRPIALRPQRNAELGSASLIRLSVR